MQQHARTTHGSPSATSSRSHAGRHYNEQDSQEHSGTSHDIPDRPSSREPHAQGSSSQDRAKADKVKQVVQNFYKRAALIIVSSRIHLPPIINPETKTPRTSQWFQLLMNESEALNDKIEDWRYVDVAVDRPRPLVIEIYLDLGEISRNQTLAVVDSRGKKWDVCEALKKAAAAKNERTKDLHLVLERWTIALDHPPSSRSSEANEPMANVYKKASIVMHSLLAYANLLPAFKFARRTMQEPATLTALRPLFRIREETQGHASRDSLTIPLDPTDEHITEKHQFRHLATPAGKFSIQVEFRKSCTFQVCNYEEIVSAQFAGMGNALDDNPAGSQTREFPYLAGGKEVGSLPADRRWAADARNTGFAHSLGTFHEGPTGTSPLSALRTARELNLQSPTGESLPQKMPPNHRTSTSSKSSLKSNESMPPPTRRPSVSFFRAGSLSSSPAQGGLNGPSPSSSYTKPSHITSGLAAARNIRQPTLAQPEVAVGSPPTGSPKPPITRYSSSFSHRRSRMSSGGTSASKEEESSSGNSSKRGSATLGIEATGGSGSSGSVHTDDENIASFLSMLDKTKDLGSFNRTDDASRDASNRRAVAALTRYRGMRDANLQLSDSLSSSVMMHRSSGASSQRLSGVPPTLVGASVSTSSSPKPISPHTPHTPTIPSRLSEEPLRARPHPATRSNDVSPPSNDDVAVDPTSSGAIPIPAASPQAIPQVRRSSSAHHRHREQANMQSLDHRPSSVPLSHLPVDDRELGLNEMFDTQMDNPRARINLPTSAESDSDDDDQRQHGPPVARRPAENAGRDAATSSVARALPYSRRPQLSSGRGSSARFSYSRAGAGDDDEPLLFTMNELSRRSLEEIRPSSGAAQRARQGSQPRPGADGNASGEDMGWSG